ncbi:MAG TPA: hypothetical protein VG756_20330 [Pseudonocardiaceae bacterium]|nr:hypothetical protein [Pseudonocardiaceae bacterium]
MDKFIGGGGGGGLTMPPHCGQNVSSSRMGSPQLTQGITVPSSLLTHRLNRKIQQDVTGCLTTRREKSWTITGHFRSSAVVLVIDKSSGRMLLVSPRHPDNAVRFAG